MFKIIYSIQNNPSSLLKKLEIQAWYSWVLWLEISHKTAISVSQGHGHIWRLSWKRLCFQAHSWITCKLVNQGLQPTGCWLEASLSPLLGWPPHRAAHYLTSDFYYSEKAKEQDRASKTKVKIFLWPKLRNDTLFLLSCFIKSESLGPAHSQRKRITQGMNIRRQGSLEAILVIPQFTEKNYFYNGQDEATGSGYTRYFGFTLSFFSGLQSCSWILTDF